jgi:hypothetical protein
MAKFYGEIGYGATEQKSPGVWDDVITEHTYRGDVIRNSRGLQEGEKVNDDISVDHSISIVADAYAREHFFAIRYVSGRGLCGRFQTLRCRVLVYLTVGRCL